MTTDDTTTAPLTPVEWASPDPEPFLRHDQTTFGARGDCVRAVAASILRLPLGDVPNFWDLPRPDGQDPDLGFGPQIVEWSKARGIFRAFVAEEDARNLCEAFAPPGMIVELVGRPNAPDRDARMHGVVGRWNGTTWECLHDPHPSRAGLRSVERVGFWMRGPEPVPQPYPLDRIRITVPLAALGPHGKGADIDKLCDNVSLCASTMGHDIGLTVVRCDDPKEHTLHVDLFGDNLASIYNAIYDVQELCRDMLGDVHRRTPPKPLPIGDPF